MIQSLESGGIRVPLTQGKFALVDEADAELVLPFKWSATLRNRVWYAYSNMGKGRPLALHRHLMGDDPRFVDHVNGDGLDNRRANLRWCSHAENIRNQQKQLDTSSRFKGVRFIRGYWQVEIEQNGGRLFLGSFRNEEAAARQYDRAARIFFGKFARTNAGMGLFSN